MTAQPQLLSEAEYLAFERASSTKHEYYNGRVYAMTGAKEFHNIIVANTIASLHSQLRTKPCRVYPSDMRIKVLQTGLNTYPDVVVVCGQTQFTDAVHDCITNPVVIIEVLSSSTERYDRGMKAQHYRTIETLRDYILIAQDAQHVEHFSRQQDGAWTLREADGLATSITLTSIACVLQLQDIYEKVDLPQEQPAITRELP